jgi:hypothetical protein
MTQSKSYLAMTVSTRLHLKKHPIQTSDYCITERDYISRQQIVPKLVWSEIALEFIDYIPIMADNKQRGIHGSGGV